MSRRVWFFLAVGLILLGPGLCGAEKAVFLSVEDLSDDLGAADAAAVLDHLAAHDIDAVYVSVFETTGPGFGRLWCQDEAGWPAQWVDLIETKTIATMPDPRLPDAQQTDEEQ